MEGVELTVVWCDLKVDEGDEGFDVRRTASSTFPEQSAAVPKPTCSPEEIGIALLGQVFVDESANGMDVDFPPSSTFLEHHDESGNEQSAAVPKPPYSLEDIGIALEGQNNGLEFFAANLIVHSFTLLFCFLNGCDGKDSEKGIAAQCF